MGTEEKQMIEELIVAEGEGAGDRSIPIPDELSLLPIKDTVLFPMVVMPLIVSRESSMKLVDDAVVGETRIIALAALKDPDIEAPQFKDIYKVGVAAAIHTMLRLPEHQRLIVQGLKRVRFVECTQSDPYMRVKIEEMPDERDWSEEEEMEIEATGRKVATAFQKVVALSPNLPDELQAPIIVTFRCPGDPRFEFGRFYDLLREAGYAIYPGKLTNDDTFRIGCIGRLGEDVVHGAIEAIRGAIETMGVESCKP